VVQVFIAPTETFPLDLRAGKKNQEGRGEKEFAPPTPLVPKQRNSAKVLIFQSM
jgi:hypothetical protein